MKDPAILFYTKDFLAECTSLTFEERGQHITLICLIHQKGHLDKKTIELNVPSVSEDVLKLYNRDEKDLLFLEWLEIVIDKRKEHSKKQKENVMKRWEKEKEKNTKRIPPYKSGIYQTDTKRIPLANEIENERVIEIVNEKYNIDIYKNIIGYLNSKIGSNFKYNAIVNKKFITARLNDGYTENDFYVVIDKKTNDWLDDSKMKGFLRPETLFGNKFESYLNAPSKTKSLKGVDIDISSMFNKEEE